MKKIKLFFLLVPVLFASADLRAQVTIGGLTDPKPGTILDLNSTVKGGLILSNVDILNLLEIPESFPGADDANTAALKEGLKGAVVYNTNSNTCVGVHVWNGEYWEGIASEAPTSAAGTPLTMLSDPVTLLGGDNVEFSVAATAKLYKWYASTDNAPYEYIGVTTEPAFSKVFFVGTHKVKVLMYNCHSVEKSNEVSFTPGSISPNAGSIAGNNVIYIYGDFPYASLSSYVDNGLVAHFDGIDNQGLGDKRHDFNAGSWKDLKNEFYLPRKSTAQGQWLSNGFQTLDNDSAFFIATTPDAYPLGNSKRTVEVIFRTPDPKDMFTIKDEDRRRIFAYGKVNVEAQVFGVSYRGTKRTGCSTDPDDQWVFYGILGDGNNLVTCLASTPSLKTPSTINTVTSTYKENMQNDSTNSYINNLRATVIDRMGSTLDTQKGTVLIGQNLSHSTFLSVRLYNRVLDSVEIATNAALDQIRYLTPPKVTIDGALCSETVVLSPHVLMCKVPPGSSEGVKTVKLNDKDYTYYTYVNSSAFYISKISPIIGHGEETLTLEGNELQTITKVEAGGQACTFVSKDSGSYVCTLPNHPAGEVDIIITTGDNTYRFAKVFEYQ